MSENCNQDAELISSIKDNIQIEMINEKNSRNFIKKVHEDPYDQANIYLSKQQVYDLFKVKKNDEKCFNLLKYYY
jgi:hypothetical protein